MSIQVKSFPVPGPLLITPNRFGDARGFFSEIYSVASFAEAGINLVFVQDNHSLSTTKGTVRGLHFQTPPHAQGKLVRVVKGSILDVVVDIRKGSPTYGKHVAAELSAANWDQLLIPMGFAHGFCTLEPNTEIIYKVTAPYAPQNDTGIRWNDPALCIAWPTFAGTVLSQKDAAQQFLAELDSPFSFAGSQ
jgi:dTDP-4-dehydrorhamnose 3,5-epimerase